MSQEPIILNLPAPVDDHRESAFWIIHFFRRGGSMKVSTIKIQNRSQIIFLGFLFTSTGQ